MNIRVLITRDGSNAIKVMDLEEYLRGVVPSEMGRKWPIEALMAQAIASRTYAILKIQARRDKYDYDVDDTTKFQAYKENNKSQITDEAITLTRGLVVSYRGELASTYYSHSNGGHVYSYSEHWGGKDLPYLVSKDDPYTTETKNGHGVGMSQCGARTMAEQGKTYKEILAFYYVGTELKVYKESKVSVKKICKVAEDDFLAIRETPQNNGKLLGKLYTNDVIEVIEENSAGWCKHSRGWSYGGKGYLVTQDKSISEGLSMKVNVRSLNVRKGPGVNYQPVGIIHSGDIVEVKEITNNFGRIGENRWCSMNFLSNI